ncbi:MAG: dynamin family protein [Oscillospiraceae bacterium]|nr:dynamin family protein [Oscillospiraceae bacterium]
MNKTVQELKKNQGRVISVLENFADLIGEMDETKKAKYGFVPGVGMETEAAQLHYNSEAIGQGIFNVLFTGVFSGGKSTLINAVLGKNLLPSSPVPETPSITKIWFGRPDAKVTVHYKDGTEDEIITVAEYQQRFRLKNGEPDERISHIDLEQEESLFENLVQLVDSPGLDSAANESKLTLEYEPKANAIVFLINATVPLSNSERDRIATKFYDRHLKNVFFVVTHMDTVTEDEDLLKKRIIEYTERVFTDENGNYDKALAERRVFFVNAYGAVCAKTGEKFMVSVGNKKVPVDIELSDTGVPEFEEALTEFLVSDEKYREAYSLNRNYLTAYFSAFNSEAEKRLSIIREGVNEKIRDKDKQEKVIKDIQNTLDNIQKLVENFMDDVAIKVQNEYGLFTQSVRADWDEYFEAKAPEVEFGLGRNAQIISETIKNKFSKDEDAYRSKVEEIMRPITDEIFKTVRVYKNGKSVEEISDDCYLGIKLASFKSNVSRKLSQSAEGFSSNLEVLVSVLISQTEGIDLDIRRIVENIYLEMGSPINVQDNGSLAQAIVTLILCRDVDTAWAALNNKFSIGDLVKNIVLTSLVELIVYTIVMTITGWGMVYLAIRTVIGIIRIGKTTNQIVTDAYADAKDKVCSELESNGIAIARNISDTLNDQVNGGVGKMNAIIAQKMKDEQQNLAKIEAALKNKQIDEKTEEARLEQIKAGLVKAYNELSEHIDGRTFTESDILLMAAVKTA